jgi:UDP-glucose 4-epimerase
MNILITGGAGYIGSHVNKLLAELGHNTIVIDNLVQGHRELVKWGEFVQLDLANVAEVEALCNARHFDAVMHFAAFALVGESVAEPSRYYENNVANTINLLSIMRRTGINKFIFSSTAAVYGEPTLPYLDERHPVAPINPYGRTKSMVEQVLRDYHTAYGLQSVSLRYFNAAGAAPDAGIGEWHRPETHLIPLALDAAIGRTNEIVIHGSDYGTTDGTCVRDYVHVDDLAAGHALALEHLTAGGTCQCFNLGNGNGYSVKEVVDTIRSVTGKDINTTLAPRRCGDAPRLVASADKAKRILGWQPVKGELRIIIETAWQWHQQRLN